MFVGQPHAEFARRRARIRRRVFVRRERKYTRTRMDSCGCIRVSTSVKARSRGVNGMYFDRGREGEESLEEDRSRGWFLLFDEGEVANI